MIEDPLLAYWWHPDMPDAMVPGMLRETSGLFMLELLESLPWRSPQVIYGESATTKYTLVYPWRSRQNIRSRLGRDLWMGMYLVPELHLEPPTFGVNKIAFRIEGLQEWTRFGGVEQTFESNSDETEIDVVVKYTRPPALRLGWGEIEVAFWTVWSMPGMESGISIETDSSIVLSSPVPLSLPDWMDRYVYPLQRLIQMLTRRKGRVWSMQILPEDSIKDLPYDVHGHRVLPSTEAIKPQAMNLNVRTCLADFMNNGSSVLESWLRIYSENHKSFDAYIEEHMTTEGYAPTARSFFTAARLIEQLRNLAGSPSTTQFSDSTIEALREVAKAAPEDEYDALLDQISGLSKRGYKSSMLLFLGELRGILEGIGFRKVDLKEISSLFINTRHVDAHHDPKRAQRAAQGALLSSLIEFSSLLIDISLLRHLGLSDDVIIERFRNDLRIAACRTLMAATMSSANTAELN